jgi:hypothetical protein
MDGGQCGFALRCHNVWQLFTLDIPDEFVVLAHVKIKARHRM